MDSTQKLLKELTDITGISGREDKVARYIAARMKPLSKITYDRLGSVICEKKGAARSPRVMIAGHMDEIGFFVKQITSEGFVKFSPVGGWWSHVILGQRVVIETKKGPVVGVVGSKAPHELDPEERRKLLQIKDMFIDVGATRGFDVEKKLGIQPGDAIVPWGPFAVMNNPKLYMAKAWDDRVGCAIFMETIKALAKAKHPNTVFGVGTVQEEVGLRGATTSASVVDPDVGFAVEVSIAHDTPGYGTEEQQALGNGPAVCVYDGSMIPNRNLVDLAVEVAKKKKIPYHFTSLERGGTDSGRIHMNKGGVPSLVIGVATRYIHSHIGVLSREDFDNAVRLMIEIVKVLDAKKVASL
jgi:putative aminopeptidase FrvX